MRVHTAFLANEARIRDGLVYVIGGVSESGDVASLPATTRLSLVVVFELGPADAEGSDDYGIEIWQASSGAQVATAHIDFASTGDHMDGAPKFRSVVIPFEAQLGREGPCEIRLTKDRAPIA